MEIEEGPEGPWWHTLLFFLAFAALGALVDLVLLWAGV